MKNNKFRIKVEEDFTSWVRVQEKHWYGWKTVCEYSVTAWGIVGAIKEAKLTVEELKKI